MSDFATLWIVGSIFLCPWNSPAKNIGVGSHFLLQGIFPTQGSNPGLLHCREILYHLSYQESTNERLSKNTQVFDVQNLLLG